MKILKDKILREPILLKGYTDDDLLSVINWYSSNKTKNDAKSYLIDYFKKNESEDFISFIRHINNKQIKSNIAWLVRILELSGFIKEDLINRIEAYKTDLYQLYYNQIKIKENKKSFFNTEPILQEYISEIEYNIDSLINNESIFNFEDFISKKKIKPFYLKQISEFYQNGLLKELNNEEKDEQLEEAYNFLSDIKRQQLIYFVKNIISNCNKSIKLNKPFRSKKKKVINVLDRVSKFKYLNSFEGLNSLHPSNILNAQEILIYDTKQRRLNVYISFDTGFDVKSSKIMNFDANLSYSKKIRKPENILPKLLENKRATIKEMLSKLKVKQKKLTGKTNSNMIILRTFYKSDI